MHTRDAIIVFEEVPVRREWHDGEQWIAAIDVAKALGYTNPSKATSDMMRRNKNRMEGYYKKLKSKKLGTQIAESGQAREMFFLNLHGTIAFCMLSDMPLAIPFQRWADKILAKKLQEIPSDIRLISKQKRVKFTDTLRDHGCDKPYHYINVTRDMKTGLGIDKNKPKESCDLIEVMKIAASEDIARINLIQNHASGYVECHDASVDAAQVVADGTICKRIVP